MNKSLKVSITLTYVFIVMLLVNEIMFKNKSIMIMSSIGIIIGVIIADLSVIIKIGRATKHHIEFNDKFFRQAQFPTTTYDYNILHPYAKDFSIFILSVITAVLGIICIPPHTSILVLACFFVFLYLVYKNIKNYKRNKIITFTENHIKIDWTSIRQSMEETIIASEIITIKLIDRSGGRGTDEIIIICTAIRDIRVKIRLGEYSELLNYFKGYCEAKEIEFVE